MKILYYENIVIIFTDSWNEADPEANKRKIGDINKGKFCSDPYSTK